MTGQTRKVAYVFNPDAGNHHFGKGHPMKPHRLSITNSLVHEYGLTEHITLFRSKKAVPQSLKAFHGSEYIDFLQNTDPKYHIDHLDKAQLLTKMTTSDNCFNLGDDCPVFHGIFDFSCMYTGSTLKAASILIDGDYRIAINWSGGLHHGRKNEAFGFCYVNDIVLACQMLLQKFRRILYVDIDVHHGDGVQDAFYFSDRVLTCSLHQFGDNFFPGTGTMFETGLEKGLNYSVNAPLRVGITDQMYVPLFKSMIDGCVDRFRPECIIMQCGADSIHGDLLGKFNLSIKGHGECLKHVMNKNLPLLALGGGGYVPKNVARLWTYETSILAGVEIPNKIPKSEYDYYFENDDILCKEPVLSEPNSNSPKYINALREHFHDQLKCIQIAPNV